MYTVCNYPPGHSFEAACLAGTRGSLADCCKPLCVYIYVLSWVPGETKIFAKTMYGQAWQQMNDKQDLPPPDHVYCNENHVLRPSLATNEWHVRSLWDNYRLKYITSDLVYLEKSFRTEFYQRHALSLGLRSRKLQFDSRQEAWFAWGIHDKHGSKISIVLVVWGYVSSGGPEKYLLYMYKWICATMAFRTPWF